jgi:hypothetical protein
VLIFSIHKQDNNKKTMSGVKITESVFGVTKNKNEIKK